MKKKQIKKLMAAIAAAGGMLAGSVNSYAQSTPTTTATNPNSAVSSDGKVVTPPTTTPGPGTGTAPGSVAPSPGTGTPVPLPRPMVPPPDTRPVPMPQPTGVSGGTVGIGTAPSTPLPTRPTTPIVPTSGGVTLSTRPATLLRLDGPVTTVSVPANPQAVNSGTLVFAGDIVRTSGPGEGVATPIPTATTPVLTLVQQFDAQRTQELAARATALAQLRTATPEQRSVMIAEMQATVQQQSIEQREAARELRNELRAMREERKGR